MTSNSERFFEMVREDELVSDGEEMTDMSEEETSGE